MTTTGKVFLAVGAVGALAAGAVGLVALSRRRGGLGLGSGSRSPERIGAMQDAIWAGVRNPQMRELALAVTGNGTRYVTVARRAMTVQGAACPARDGRCESDAVGRWVAQNRAVAAQLLPAGQDSPAALACALLSLNGITCRLRLAGAPQTGRAY